MGRCAAIRGYSARGQSLTFWVLASASLQLLPRGIRDVMRADDADISATRVSTNATNEALGVGRPIASIGAECSLSQPCGPPEVFDISCFAPNGSLCESQGGDCSCRRPEGAVCVDDSDCIHGCGTGNGQCVCHSANAVKSDNPSCARSTCMFGQSEAFVCQYNAWSPKYREMSWEDSSMFGMLYREYGSIQPAAEKETNQTNGAILQRFLQQRKYAGTYTQAQLLQHIQKGLRVATTHKAVKKAGALESIPVSYELSHISELLAATEKLAHQNSFIRRYTDTATTVENILNGLLDTSQYGLWLAYHLGLKHKRYSAAAKMYGEHWSATPGPAITMEGMLWTELTFSVVPVDFAEREGTPLSEDEMNSLTVLWSVIGNALGVEYQFATWKAAKEIFERLKAGPDHYSRLSEQPQAVKNLLGVFSLFKPSLEAILRT